ncbi:hypothetical protein AGMMS49546_36820 [Spirochaetia bacterium]|nr:hypothetical protein AGMMS49546_36820 [Spirochaetia bacterium]
MNCITCCAEQRETFPSEISPPEERVSLPLAEGRAYRYFQQQGFRPADRDSFPIFRQYEQSSGLQEMSAAIIASWSFIYHGLYKIIGGYLCGVYFYEGKPVYFTLHRPPEGFAVPAVAHSLKPLIDTFWEMSRDAGLPFLQIKFIDEAYLAEYRHVPGYRVVTERRDSDDEYVYRVQDLLELSGAANFYKRKRLKRCFDRTDITLRPMTNENVHICLEVEEQWCRGKDCTYCASFGGCEKKALEIMIDLFDDRIHKGLFLYQDDKPSGYIICEKMSESLSQAYFGKAVMEGYFVYLIYMMYKTCLTGVEYMNLNEDMGSMGLRLFKSHLSVHELWPKYICTYTKAEVPLRKKGCAAID